VITLGIDIGTQSLKVVVTDARAILGQAQVSLTLEYPRPSWVEQDPRQWDAALPQAIARALAAAKIKAAEVLAVAVSGQLDGCIAVDQECEPLSPCLVWMDRRAKLPTLTSEQRRHFTQTTGQVFDASHMAAKIAWLKEEGLPAGARFHQPTSYLVERLCGAYVFAPSLASTTMLYSLEEEDFAEHLLQPFSLLRSELPSVKPAHSVAGQLTALGATRSGLMPGTVVAVGTGDDFATLWGAGVTRPGTMLCALGTAEVVGCLSSKLVIDSEGLVETHPFLHGYYIENPGWLSGGALRWLRTILMVESDSELDHLAEDAPIGCDGLVFLPALSGSMAPSWQPDARGCFYGLTAAHTRAHMARSVLEGCAFAMKDVRDRLLVMGLTINSIVLLGGGARSRLWAQMRSDVCQLQLFASEHDESSALGAALLARSALQGIDPEKYSQAVCHSRTRYSPREENDQAYQMAYDRYRKLFASLAPMWE